MPESVAIKNAFGGINQEDRGALDRAKRADLVTLPRDVRGTNCFNCKFVKDKTMGKGFCKHPEVYQYVNERMCCALWSANGIYTPFKRGGKFG